MRFGVNGQSYMLSFNNNGERWYLVTCGGKSPMKAIPVINDDDIGFVPNIVVQFDGGHASIN